MLRVLSLVSSPLFSHAVVFLLIPHAPLMWRHQFARSLAAFNIAAYILGIGDRHLENWLLDQTDGSVLGIDFGLAFGVGTSQLGVPELIPVRLTQQFTSLLQPLDSRGLLLHNMVRWQETDLHARADGGCDWRVTTPRFVFVFVFVCAVLVHVVCFLFAFVGRCWPCPHSRRRRMCC